MKPSDNHAATYMDIHLFEGIAGHPISCSYSSKARNTYLINELLFWLNRHNVTIGEKY